MIYLTFVFGAKHSWYQCSKYAEGFAEGNFFSLRASFASLARTRRRGKRPRYWSRVHLIVSTDYFRLAKLVKNFYSAFFAPTLLRCIRVSLVRADPKCLLILRCSFFACWSSHSCISLMEKKTKTLLKTKPEFPLKLIVLKEVPVSSVLAGVLEDAVCRKGK